MAESTQPTHGSQLVTAQHVQPGRVDADRIDVFEAPAPGSYWRLLKGVKKSTTTRLKCPEMSSGTVLMLSTIEMADGQPHVYRFASHPRWEDAEVVAFHADDFLANWERCPEGESLRLEDLSALQNEMRDTQALMMQAPPDCLSPLLLGRDASHDVGHPGKALVTEDAVDAMSRRAAALQSDAERRTAWISQHSETLASQGGMLANFHRERAEAALAKASTQLDQVHGLLRTVDNLRIYTGHGYEVITLREGPPAAANAPLTIYQDLLALDEEALILLDQGGLDHTQTESLAEALADPALLARLIPAERGIVLARFRATHKEFVTPKDVSDIAAHAYNAQMSAESQRPRLLLRDGDRLLLIDGEEILGPIKQLMPSTAEQDKHFTRKARWRDEQDQRITREDLDYAAAQRSQLGALDHYGKVMILLWGLRDRGVILDESEIPRFANWFDEGFMTTFLRLVSHDDLLGVTRASYAEWRDKQNAYLAKGSWIAINLRKIWTQKRVPGAYSRGRWVNGKEEHERLWAPDISNPAFLRVQSDKGGLFVTVPTSYVGFNHSAGSKQRNVRLTLATSEYDTLSELLVMDRAHAPDLAYYLQSRAQRRAYSSYLELFRAAGTWLADRDVHEAQWREALHQAVDAAGFAYDTDHLAAAITDALAVARTSRRDGVLPAFGANETTTIALNSLHAALRGNSDRIAAVERWGLEASRRPLRLAYSGKEGWILYVEPTREDIDARLWSDKGAHVMAGNVEFQRDEASFKQTDTRPLRAVSHEQIIKDWQWEQPLTKEQIHTGHLMSREPKATIGGAPLWLQRKPLFKLPYREAVTVLDSATTSFEDWLQNGPTPAQIIENAAQYMRADRSRYVARQRLIIPVGTALRHDGIPVVLALEFDALIHAYAVGTQEDRLAVRATIERHYAHPEGALKSLDRDEPGRNLVALALTQAATLTKRGFYAEDIPHWSVHEGYLDLKSRKYSTTLFVTGFHPRAIELVPHLAKVLKKNMETGHAK